jgi:pyridine nucleotide-disulfide oxidoreductase
MKPIHAQEDVLVIGAGPAGIASAYALKKAKISYKVIDRADKIGSTWDKLYPSLTLNTSRYFSHMPEKPFPRHYPIFPSARQYHDYLLEYVREQNFNIHLGISVSRVSREGNFWRVESNEGDFLYKAVIPATGIWNNPITPDIEGMDCFRGDIIHAQDYRAPQQIENKRVLVVGNGPTGIDLSVAASEVAQSVHIAIRSGVQLKRRYPLGLPTHAWLMLTEPLPKSCCRTIMKWLGSFDYGDLSDIGLASPKAGEGGMTAYQGRELVDAVKAGKIHPVPEPIRFYPNKVEFADTQCLPFDIVIMATGYLPVLHQYLDIEMQYNSEEWQKQSICDWEIGPNGQRGFPLRDTSKHPNGREIVGHRGLYLVGVFYKGKGAMYNMNIEAKIAADEIQDYLADFRAKI